MQYENAIHAVLGMKEGLLYKNCRYSLLHKVIQDATYSSTNEWRYRHPEFYWSLEAVEELAQLAGAELPSSLPKDIELMPPDLATARDLLHQEHVVPTGVVIRHLLQLVDPSLEQIAEVLDRGRIVCIVTRDENRRLHKNRMPPQQANFLLDKWARYHHPREGKPVVVSPYSCAWQGATLKFTAREGTEPDAP